MCINRSSYGISVLTSYDVQGEKDGRQLYASYTCDTYLSVRHMIYICIIYILLFIGLQTTYYAGMHMAGFPSSFFLVLFGSFWCQTSMFRRRDDSACLLSAALIHRTTPCALLTTHHVCILLLDRKTTHVCWMRRLNKKNAWKT